MNETKKEIDFYLWQYADQCVQFQLEAQGCNMT